MYTHETRAVIRDPAAPAAAAATRKDPYSIAAAPSPHRSQISDHAPPSRRTAGAMRVQSGGGSTSAASVFYGKIMLHTNTSTMVHVLVQCMTYILVRRYRTIIQAGLTRGFRIQSIDFVCIAQCTVLINYNFIYALLCILK